MHVRAGICHWRYRRISKFSPYVSACCACAQRPGFVSLLLARLRSTRVAAPVLFAHAEVTKNTIFSMLPKLRFWRCFRWFLTIAPLFAGAGQLPNFCPPQYTHGTYNIESYTLGGFTIGNTKDHSKLAIVDDGKTFCIGGINRMTSQEKRCVAARAVTCAWHVSIRGGGCTVIG